MSIYGIDGDDFIMLFPIKAALFYILFMETACSHKLEDATMPGLLLVVLCFPARSAAVSSFSG